MTDKLLLSVTEVASLLGCGRTFVYGMIQRGELPVVKLGRLTRIPVQAVVDVARGEDRGTCAPSADTNGWPRSRGL